MMGRKKPNSFTLIEMLVVISIIGILVGLLLPALQASKRKARKTRAKREVKELQEAWLSYRLEFKKFPIGITHMESNAIALLRGDNPRNIQFMDFRTNTEYYVDPWGTPGTMDGVYYVMLDEDGDNQVSVGLNVLSVSVAVWSAGPDKVNLTSDDVVSW